MRTSHQTAVRIDAIDLFCGAGGLTYGLQKAGVRVVAGFDADPDCEFPYSENNSAAFRLFDVNDLRESNLAAEYGQTKAVKLLAGCAPCQPFSTYSRTRVGEDDRWGLLHRFRQLARSKIVDLVTMENVPQLARHPVFAEFEAGLVADGYETDWEVVDCCDVGVPQTRKRLVFMASRLGKIRVSFRRNSTGRTVRDAIGHLPAIEAGETHPRDSFHRACALSPLNKKRMLASTPGGTWRDWPTDIQADCHRKESGQTYPGVYGRMSWDDPGSTMTTQFFGYGNGRFGHPEQHRAISLREAALLQTFPKKYRFERPGERRPTGRMGRLIGNAVPPRLALQIGRTLIHHVQALGHAG